MTRLSVPDMNCGHCKATVERVIRDVDPAARVEIDLETRTAAVEVTDLAPVLAALADEGYPAALAG
jgi:copper chaperone